MPVMTRAGRKRESSALVTAEEQLPSDPGPSLLPKEEFLRNMYKLTPLMIQIPEENTPNVHYLVCYVFYKDMAWMGMTKNLRDDRPMISQYLAANEPLKRLDDELIFPRFPTDGSLSKAASNVYTDSVYMKYPRLDEASPASISSDNIASTFLEEVRNAERLHRAPHPNIVRYLGCHVRRGRIIGYLMEKVPLSLYDYKAKDPRFARVQKHVFLDRLQDVLDHMHSLGIAHNDLRPQNIMVSAEGLPILIDFGTCFPFGQKTGAAGVPRWVLMEKREQWRISNKANDEYAMKLLWERFDDEVQLNLRKWSEILQEKPRKVKFSECWKTVLHVSLFTTVIFVLFLYLFFWAVPRST